MPYKKMFVLLEGADDERFFERIVRPIFEKTYDSVKSWRYAQAKKEKVRGFLRSITLMGADCFFWADINSEPCVTAKKDAMTAIHGDCIPTSKIIVVVKEIESWYLAGLDSNALKELDMKRVLSGTDNITKEQFNDLMPDKFDSRIDLMAEIIKRFCVETAREKNRSFNYLMAKL